jgi:hypothetical protein
MAGVPLRRDYFGDQGECSTEYVFLSPLWRAVTRNKSWHTYPGVSRPPTFVFCTETWEGSEDAALKNIT